jgi:hypothetical protein
VVRLSEGTLYAALRKDRTWQGPFTLDTTPEAYPSTVELADGSVLAVYYEEGEGSTIRARRFRVEASGLRFLPLDPEPRVMGSRLEPFVDLHLVDRLDGCELRLHTPQPAGVTLQFDQPWEGAFTGYITVLT